MKKEELRNAMIGTTTVKFHHWVVKNTEDDDDSKISFGLVEYPDGIMREVSHAYIKFID